MKTVFVYLLVAYSMYGQCQKSSSARKIDSSYKPDVNVANFSNPTQLTNPYYLLVPGKIYHYEGHTSDGFEVVEEQRSKDTKVIDGITCIVSKFKASADGQLIEEADDWIAQDNDGNVWYFGEAVNNYNKNGTLKDHAGSWEAGVGDARPGIVMPANPAMGLKYREEYYPNEAEDEAEIIGVSLDATIPFGHFTNCIKTKNFTALEPGQIETKLYAPGVGLIKETETDNAEILLISIK